MKSVDNPKSPLPETIEVLGMDGNTHTKIIDHLADESPKQASPNLGSHRINRDQSGTTNAAKGFDALGSLDILQHQLV